MRACVGGRVRVATGSPGPPGWDEPPGGVESARGAPGSGRMPFRRWGADRPGAAALGVWSPGQRPGPRGTRVPQSQVMIVVAGHIQAELMTDWTLRLPSVPMSW